MTWALEIYISMSYLNIWQTESKHFHHCRFWIFLHITFEFLFDNLTYNACNLIPFLLFCRMELASFSVTPLWATTKSSYFVITYEHSNNFLLQFIQHKQYNTITEIVILVSKRLLFSRKKGVSRLALPDNIARNVCFNSDMCEISIVMQSNAL